jgi:hypothetical protein
LEATHIVNVPHAQELTVAKSEPPKSLPASFAFEKSLSDDKSQSSSFVKVNVSTNIGKKN